MVLDDVIKQIPSVNQIRTTELDLEIPFSALAARFSHQPGTVVLMSGGDLDCARHHILALNPWLHFSGKKKKMTLQLEKKRFEFEADPLYSLKKIVEAAKGDLKALPKPIQAGLFGYLSYDLKNHLENLPRTAMDDLHLPEICFWAPGLIVVEDRIEKRRWLHGVKISGWKTDSITELKDRFHRMCAGKPKPCSPFQGNPDSLKSNFSKASYLSALEAIHEYIAAGHVYQVNMSQRFSMRYSGSGFDLFQRLFEMNPAPFFAYINAGDHEIVSTSPERFLLQDGHRLETRPIKGTRRRGRTAAEDQALRRELLSSDKEEAELSMIVDLMRNDLGRVCREKSVVVTEHRRVEAYENVYHLISIVTGELTAGCDAVDVITATFPGGSITGCPKVRSMEIIDELEPTCRHLYTGAIGYLSLHDTMDLSIAIRTAILTKGRIHFGVGGGIVYDSQPEAEFEETLHKGQTLMTACLGRETPSRQPPESPSSIPKVWFNGVMMPAPEARLPISDAGFQYGFGFFETILAENGNPRLLRDHLARFKKSWQALYRTPFPDLSWREIISTVLQQNDLAATPAAVKIMTAWAHSDSPPFHPHIIVTARPYTHRLAPLNRKGLYLGIYPHPRQTPLADHKTLNYLYYFQAGQWAKSNNFDEALIQNPDGSLSETNTGNLALIFDNQLIEPVSPHVLPGVMATQLRRAAREEGLEIVQKVITREMLPAADQVWVSNALMGVVPVLRIEEMPVNFSETLYTRIKQRLMPPQTTS